MSQMCWKDYEEGKFNVIEMNKVENQIESTNDSEEDKRTKEKNKEETKEDNELSFYANNMEEKMINKLYAEYLISEKTKIIKKQLKEKGKKNTSC